MKTYYISVTESLVKTVEVHAENEQEALQKAEDSYYNDEFELDYNDRVDTEFENDTEGTLESYDNGGMPKFYEIQ